MANKGLTLFYECAARCIYLSSQEEGFLGKVIALEQYNFH